MNKDVKPIFRPPIITILGHVDHGKTSLLDKIRSSRVTAGEAGGITQATSAYQVDYQGRTLTFIDTPGHAAFSGMRRRGGALADIAVLVVAADDGVMPQTKESLEFINSAKTPFVVAINKIDLEGTNILKIKTQLAELGVYVEGFGGNTPVVEISAKTGKNIDTLLETIVLMADLEELKDTSSEVPSAFVLESETDPQKGPMAVILVKTGIFNVRELLYNQDKKPVGKIRAMFDFKGVILSQATPSTPVQIIGMTETLSVGELLTTASQADLVSKDMKSSLSTARDLTVGGINIVLKSDVAGSLEAIEASLPVGVNLVSKSVGLVTESDIHLAQVEAAQIICFNSKINSSVKKLAQTEAVKIVSFKIIYELLDYLSDVLAGKAKEDAVLAEIGQAKVIKLFDFAGQKVYGCRVLSGKLRLNDMVEGSTIISLRIGRDTTPEVKKDQECGLVLKPELDLKEGDTLKSHSN